MIPYLHRFRANSIVYIIRKNVTKTKTFIYNSQLKHQTLKIETMGNLLYTVAIILVVIWAIGFFAYSAEAIIHILLVIAVIAVILRVIQGDKIIK